MGCILLALLLSFGVVTAAPNVAKAARIAGGSLTTIEEYPIQVALLISWDFTSYPQGCGGFILNYRHVVTSATCVWRSPRTLLRVRVGSTFANSGGIVHNVQFSFPCLLYNSTSFENDIAVIRIATLITYNAQAQPAVFADANYYLGDNQPVWAAGWGATSQDGPYSEQLRHVQLLVVNQTVCRNRYAWINNVTDNMLCAGWIGVGGRDQCEGDGGGPLIHNGVVVGVRSWGEACGNDWYPGVNTRISKYSEWLQSYE